MEQYYSPSGKFSPSSFVLWIVAALIVLPIIALGYAYAIWYIPIPYLNFFITGIFGFLIGFIINMLVIKPGKVRNKTLEFIFTLLGALIAIYVHWAVWVDLAFNVTDTYGTDRIGIAASNISFAEVIALILQPGELFNLIGAINEVGVWSLKGATVSGIFLTIIWIIEFVAIMVISLLVGSGQASKPYCELENTWFEENELNAVSFIADGAGFVKALSTGDMDVLNSTLLPAQNVEAEDHAVITLYDAKSGENFVSVDNEIGEPNDKGEIKFTTQSITSYLRISQEIADKLKSVS